MKVIINDKKARILRDYKYDVLDLPEKAWEDMGKILISSRLREGTDHKLNDCESIMNVKFREPSANECPDSLVSILEIQARTPYGAIVKRLECFDADELANRLPINYFWGVRADRSEGVDL